MGTDMLVGVEDGPTERRELGRDTSYYCGKRPSSGIFDALNFIAALAALPVIYALLARAAVVFSQRTKRNKTLSVRQLFALADRRFMRSFYRHDKDATSLAALGTALIVLAIVLPPIRAILVYTEIKLFPEAGRHRSDPNRWDGAEFVALDPTLYQVSKVLEREAIENTRHALIHAFPNEWMTRAWRDTDRRGDYSYFVSAVPRDTTTGLYRQHALRMNSSVACQTITKTEFPSKCGRYQLTYENANLTANVCVPNVLEKSPWNVTFIEDRQDLTEQLYIDVSRGTSGEDTYNDWTILCTGNTSLGYFELGNHFNGGKPGPLLSRFKLSSHTAKDREFTDHLTDFEIPHGLLTTTDQAADTKHMTHNTMFDAQGPLATTAQALFGADSFFDLAQSIKAPEDSLSETLCRLSPIPLQRVYSDLRRCEPYTDSYDNRWGRFYSRWGWANDRVHSLIEQIVIDSRAALGDPSNDLLTTAMYIAAQAHLEAATAQWSRRSLGRPNQIWRADGIEVRTPVVSLAAKIAVSVLLGLQAVAVLALVWYVYSVPTWTETLDAMAILRVAGHLELLDRGAGLLRPEGDLGLSEVTREQLTEMAKMDALVGAVEVEHLKAGKPDVSKNGKYYLLSVGAPGLVHRYIRRKS